nr:hypothetical protein [Streptomyces sp. TRM72054]
MDHVEWAPGRIIHPDILAADLDLGMSYVLEQSRFAIGSNHASIGAAIEEHRHDRAYACTNLKTSRIRT